MEKEIKYYCNKCDKCILSEDMNECELEELQNEGSFVCTDCIQEEMEKD